MDPRRTIGNRKRSDTVRLEIIELLYPVALLHVIRRTLDSLSSQYVLYIKLAEILTYYARYDFILSDFKY